MQKKIACFAGHSLLCDCTIIERIMDCAEYYICTEGINEFWVGSYGDFDRYAQKAINKLKSRYPYIKLVYVVPYLSKRKIKRGMQKSLTKPWWQIFRNKRLCVTGY